MKLKRLLAAFVAIAISVSMMSSLVLADEADNAPEETAAVENAESKEKTHSFPPGYEKISQLGSGTSAARGLPELQVSPFAAQRLPDLWFLQGQSSSCPQGKKDGTTRNQIISSYENSLRCIRRGLRCKTQRIRGFKIHQA